MSTTSTSTSTSASVSTAVASAAPVAASAQSALGAASTSASAGGASSSAATATQGPSNSLQQTPLAQSALAFAKKPSLLAGAQAQQAATGIQGPLYSGTPGGAGPGHFPSAFFSAAATQYKQAAAATAPSQRLRPSRPVPFEVANQNVQDVDGFGFAVVSENTGVVLFYDHYPKVGSPLYYY